MNNMFRYKFPVRNSFIYTNIGVSNAVSINETNQLVVNSVFSTLERVEHGKSLLSTRNYKLGYLLGIGAKYKKYSFEVRYEKAQGMSDFRNISSTTSSFFFLLGYRL